MLKNVMVVIVVAGAWWICGFAIAFGDVASSGGFVGKTNYYFGANLGD
jgi:ammonia channel protein AmtB